MTKSVGMALPPTNPPSPPDAAARAAQASGLHARLTKFKRPLSVETLRTFHQWEAEARPLLEIVGVSKAADPDDRLVHYRASLRQYISLTGPAAPSRKRRSSVKVGSKHPRR